MSAKGNDILRICLGIAMIIFGILGTIGIIPNVSAKRTPVVYVIAVGMIIWGVTGFRSRKKEKMRQEQIRMMQGEAGSQHKAPLVKPLKTNSPEEASAKDDEAAETIAAAEDALPGDKE